MAHLVDPTIAAWQADRQEIGMVEFLPPDTATSRFPYYRLPSDSTLIGVMEADALCLMEDGSLRVYDHESPGRVLCLAARNQLAFVEAMNVLEDYFDRCGEDDNYCDDESAAVAVRERCTSIAGGDEFAPFFTSLVGV